ncbi:hypothetical protein [Rhizobium sp. BG4]|uniref:hypothetical protein n=1 Tax=Rhizobium sp. BG4 TaxID=2613770 RepID=UPI001FEFCF63|nr:hypothetical protein [Rhizobium sp. BG4]
MKKPTRAKRILIIGHGVLGGDVLDFLLQSGMDLDVIVAGRNSEMVLHRVNLARYTAMNLGFCPAVEIVR